MMTSLGVAACLLLLPVVTGLNLSCAPCGVRRVSRRPRVVGGSSAVPGQLPWTALLEWRRAQAGAVIVSERHLLTSAHGLHTGYDVSGMTAVIGQHDRRVVSVGERRIRVEKVTLHNFNETTLENDLALVRLAEPIVWNLFAQPVCLPDSEVSPSDPEADVTAIVAGWGLLRESSNFADSAFAEVLQWTEIPIISRARCLQWLSESSEEEDAGGLPLTDTQLCAGYRDGGRDSCLGDSGGPLVVQTGGRFILAGVVSYGHGCGRQKSPGIYTDVFKYRHWIQDKMAEHETELDKMAGHETEKDKMADHRAKQNKVVEQEAEQGGVPEHEAKQTEGAEKNEASSL